MDSNTPYLTHKDQRVLLLPMEIQPVGELDVAGTYDHKFGREIYYEDSLGRTFESPIRVGEMVPVREEWKPCRIFGDDWEIHYRDGGLCPLGNVGILCHLGLSPFENQWQPASTMPDFAVRYWRRATKVEAVYEPESMCDNCGGSGWHVEPSFPIDSYGNPTPVQVQCGKCGGEGGSEPVWQWRIDIGTQWLGGSCDEAQAIYDRYECKGSWAFNCDGNTGVGGRAHLLGPRNGTYRQVDIGDVVWCDGDSVMVSKGIAVEPEIN